MREALIQLWDFGRELVAALAVRFLLEFLGEFSGRSPRLSRRERYRSNRQYAAWSIEVRREVFQETN
jgi:hypothetical protein